MFLDTQNNCVRGESSTMEATCLLHGDPVPDCARRYLHLRKNNAPPDTSICTYYVLMCAAPKYVIGNNTMELLRAIAKQIGSQRLLFPPYEISSHSLRSGGVMTLHQARISNSTIKIIGRWRLDAFLIYFQGKVDTLTKGFSKVIAAVPWFTHQVPTPSPV